MHKRVISLLVAGLALGGAVMANAQENSGPRNAPADGHCPPPPHHGDPLMRALDTNKDGVISADEIAAAPTALRALDKNNDGQVTLDELLPPRPADAPPPPTNAGPHHPPSPLFVALDVNRDGALSADEIANAASSLAALDTNHDGQLTHEEFRPAPPQGLADDDLPPPPEE
jgi:hypothetical protein